MFDLIFENVVHLKSMVHHHYPQQMIQFRGYAPFSGTAIQYVLSNIRVISFSSVKVVFFHIWRRHRIWTQTKIWSIQNLKHPKAKGQDHSTIQPAPGGLELSTAQPTCSAHALVAQHLNRLICCLNDCCKNYFNPRLGVSQDPPKSVSLLPKRATQIDERLGSIPFWAHFS